jgi:hypothetical protein
MDEQHRRHGISDFQFVDEILTVKSLRNLAHLLPGRNYRWYGETRFSPTIDRRLADALYAAGCRRLDLGLESFNQDVLDRMRKEIKVAWIEPDLDALLGAGISVHLFAIAGFPGEARWQTARTVEFATGALALSRDHYGVPDSTFGIGPFVLDALSPVAAKPADFDVRLLHPDPSEDLQMALRYTYHGALPEPADATEQDVALRADAILRGASNSQDQPPEEVMFLRAGESGRSLRELAGSRRAHGDNGADRVRCLPADWQDRPLRLAGPWVTQVRGGPETLLYEPTRSALLTMPSRLLDRLPAAAAEIADGADDLTALLAGLHHGCLEPVQDPAVFYLSGPADLGPALLLKLGPGGGLERIADTAWLTCRTTGRRLRLSAAGEALVSAVISHGEVGYGDLLRRFSPPAMPRVRAFVWRLLALGYLSARSPSHDSPATNVKEVTTCRA